MTTTKPTPCAYGQLTYFPATSSLVLIDTGSLPAFPGASLQTWQFKNGDWSLTNAGLANNPAPRTHCGMGYDGTNLILFGGKGPPSTGLFNSTDLYSSGSAWSNAIANDNSLGLNIGTTNGLTIRFNPYMFSLSTGVLLYGGTDLHPAYLQDQWLWTHASQTWTLQSPSNVPSVRTEAAFASNGTDTAVIFGGANSSNMLNDTVVFTTGSTTWTTLATNTAPSVRRGATLAWYPTGGYFLLVGGQRSDGSLLLETWSLSISGSNGTWTNLAPTTLPSGRVGAVMAYDTASSQMILFGGKSGTGTLNDTWQWSGSNWTQL